MARLHLMWANVSSACSLHLRASLLIRVHLRFRFFLQRRRTAPAWRCEARQLAPQAHCGFVHRRIIVAACGDPRGWWWSVLGNADRGRVNHVLVAEFQGNRVNEPAPVCGAATVGFLTESHGARQSHRAPPRFINALRAKRHVFLVFLQWFSVALPISVALREKPLHGSPTHQRWPFT